MQSLLVIFTYCINNFLPAAGSGVLAALCWKTDPRWTEPCYSLQCLRTPGTARDTYKWLVCTVFLGQGCCRAWPDGLWSTLMWCSTHAACPSPEGPVYFSHRGRKRCSTAWTILSGTCRFFNRSVMSVWFHSACKPWRHTNCELRNTKRLQIKPFWGYKNIKTVQASLFSQTNPW